MKSIDPKLKSAIKTIIIFLIVFFLITDMYKMASQIITNQAVIVVALSNISQDLQEIKTAIEADYQTVILTAYHPKSRGINSDSNPNKTALMKKPIAGYTCAVSDELLRLGWIGKKIYLDGYGVWEATDKMKKSVKGKRIDLCAPSLKYAKEFGVEKNVLAIVLD